MEELDAVMTDGDSVMTDSTAPLNPHVEDAIRAVRAGREDDDESPFENFGSHQNYFVRR